MTDKTTADQSAPCLNLGNLAPEKGVVASVFQYPGGKARLAGWIASLLPSPGTYQTFVDLFGGAANVLLEVMRRNDAAGTGEVLYIYNDIDEELVNFFRVIREPELRRALQELLHWTPYSRRQYQECLEMPVPDDPVRRAWRFFTLMQQSFSTVGDIARTSAGRWGYRVSSPNFLKKWLNSQERLGAFGEIFRRVQIECLDFAEILERYAGREVLVYADPPYYPETRVDTKLYACELPPERHEELAGLLNAFPGMAAISGYCCPEYNEWYAGWERHDRDMPCSMSHVGGTRETKGQPRPRRVESLWLNPAAVRARGKGLRQVRLF